MHIVNREQIKLAKPLPERIEAVVANRCDVFVCELFACDVPNMLRATSQVDVALAYALEQMRLSNAALAMNEQRRYATCLRVLSQAAGGRVGQFVGSANDEIVQSPQCVLAGSSLGYPMAIGVRTCVNRRRWQLGSVALISAGPRSRTLG